MEKRQLYCSTGTMVERMSGYRWQLVNEHMPELMEKIPIDGIELMMLPVYYDQMNEMAKSFLADGLKFPVIHCEKEVGTMFSRAEGNDINDALDLFRLNCEMGAMVNSEKMVLHLWGGRESDSHVDDNIALIDTLLSIIEPYNIRLLIENIPCTHSSPLENWRKIYPYFPRVGFVYDTRFGELHLQSPEILSEVFLWEKKDFCCYRKSDSDVCFSDSPVCHVHISDFNGGYKDFSALRPILHPCEGKIDFPMIARKLDENGYSGSITLESPVMTENGLDIDKLKNSLTYIRKLMVDREL